MANYVIKDSQDKPPLFQDSGDKLHTPKANRMFLAWCGCGGIVSRINAVLDYAKLQSVDRIARNTSISLRRYIDMNHLAKREPSLNYGTFAVLIDPINHEMLNIYDKSKSVQDLQKEAYEFGEHYRQSIKH